MLGTLVGALIYKNVGSAAALMVSGAGKLLVTLMFFFNSAEREAKGEGDEKRPKEVV